MELLTWIEDHSGLASWLQGIGGLLAVVAAAGIAVVEGRRATSATTEALAREEARQARQEAQEHERLRTFRHSAAALITLAHNRVVIAHGVFAYGEASGLAARCGIHSRDLAGMEAQLMAFPYYELADVEAADVFAQARTAITATRLFLDFQESELVKRYENNRLEIAHTLDGFAENLAVMKELFAKRISD